MEFCMFLKDSNRLSPRTLSLADPSPEYTHQVSLEIPDFLLTKLIRNGRNNKDGDTSLWLPVPGPSHA